MISPSLRRLAPVLILAGTLAALAPAQKVVAWGRSSYGASSVPAELLSGVSAVDAGGFSLALKGGKVFAWGYNKYGQTKVPTEALSGVTAISAGSEHALALKGGMVIAWGRNNVNQCTVPAEALSGVTAISAGSEQSLALKNGRVIAWGGNRSGESSVPQEAESGVTAIVAGKGGFSIAVKNGKLLYWGNYSLRDAYYDPPTGVSAISAGASCILALRSGTVWAAGGGVYDSYGEGVVPPEAMSGVVAIASGYYHSLALKADGTVVAWGYGPDLQTTVPTELQGSFLGISGSDSYSLGLQAESWATLEPSTVYAGDASVGTVHLANAAGAGGVAVPLVSDDAGVHVPASVNVAAGATTATFPVTTDLSFGPDRTASIRTVYGGATVAAKLTMNKAAVSLAFDRATVASGSAVTLKVELANALGSDTTFDFLSTGPVAGVPSTVTVPAGQTEVQIPLTASSVTAEGTATVSLTYGGKSLGTASLQVLPKWSVRLAPDKVASGDGTTATVTLSAVAASPVTFRLSSGDALVTVPSSVTIPAGQRSASFLVSTTLSQRTLDVPISASIGSVAFSDNLRVSAATSVRSVSGPSSVYGNGRAVFTVTLNRTAGAGGYEIALASSSSDLSVPTSIIVPEGASSTTFEAGVTDVAALATATVNATGRVNAGSVTVSLRPNTPSTLVLSAHDVASGGSFTGTVTLKAVVAVDTVVQVSSGDPLVTVPATVTIPAGSKTGTFAASAGTVAKSKNVTITITKSGVSLGKGVKVLP